MSAAPQTSPVTGAGANDDASCRQAAAKVRRERPAWVVIWVARTSRFRAWPLFRAPHGTGLTATTPDDLITQMLQVEQAAQAPRARPRRTDT